MNPVQGPHKGSIYILDADRKSREELRDVLQTAGYDVICFADKKVLRKNLKDRAPSCIFFELSKDTSDLEILADLADYPAPLLVTSWYGDIPTAVKIMKAGAIDFVSRPLDHHEIVRRLEIALTERRIQTEGFQVGIFPRRQGLSSREREVIDQIAVGLSSKQIASVLGISWRTVDDHRARIMRKLGVRNAAELMIAIMNGARAE